MKFMKSCLWVFFDLIKFPRQYIVYLFITQGSTGMDGMFGQPGQRGKPVSLLHWLSILQFTIKFNVVYQQYQYEMGFSRKKRCNHPVENIKKFPGGRVKPKIEEKTWISSGVMVNLTGNPGGSMTKKSISSTGGGVQFFSIRFLSSIRPGYF